MDERLYIHLRKTRETTFCCYYKQVDEGEINFHYEETLLKTEEEMMREQTQAQETKFFSRLRIEHLLILNGWEERIGELPWPEEVNFLNTIDEKVKSRTK